MMTASALSMTGLPSRPGDRTGESGRGGRAERAQSSSSRRCPALSSSRSCGVDLVAGDHRQLAGGDGAHRGGTHPAFEHGALAVEGAGAVLGDALVAHLDADHAVEHQEELLARRALLDDDGPGLDLADLGLGAALHHMRRELAFECGLELGGDGGGVAGHPTGCACRRPGGTSC